VEHMRQLSDVFAVQANKAGSLRLSVLTDDVKVDTQWNKCTVPNMVHEPQEEDQTQEDEPDPEQMFGVLLSVRCFLKFLSSHVVSTTTIACKSFLVKNTAYTQCFIYGDMQSFERTWENN